MAATERYERLRRHAVGKHVLPKDRDGVALFHRYGLWRWVYTTKEIPETTAHRPDSTVPLVDAGESAIIVHLLAQVAVATRYQRRTR